MNIRKGGIVCAGMIVLCCAAAQSNSNSGWVGVWQGELDGQPSVILTLAEDTGTLGGTLVLNIINREDGRARVIASEPHVLVRPSLEEHTLSFQLNRIDESSNMMDFTVTLTAHGTANIHCLNCGEDAPVVEMRKED
jgi:hypothetical protein